MMEHAIIRRRCIMVPSLFVLSKTRRCPPPERRSLALSDFSEPTYSEGPDLFRARSRLFGVGIVLLRDVGRDSGLGAYDCQVNLFSLNARARARGKQI